MSPVLPGCPTRHQRQRQIGVAQLGIGLEAPAGQDHAAARRRPRGALVRRRSTIAPVTRSPPRQRARSPARRAPPGSRARDGGLEHPPQAGPGSLARSAARTAGSGRDRPRGSAAMTAASRRRPRRRPARCSPPERGRIAGPQAGRAANASSTGAVGLAEAERVEVVDGRGPVDLEQEAARVHAVATALRRPLDDRHRAPASWAAIAALAPAAPNPTTRTSTSARRLTPALGT